MIHRFYPVALAIYVILCGLLTCTLVNAAQRRTALVIGNADYTEGRLRNPVNDASDISTALKQLGFEVTTLLDANLQEMEDALDKFNKSLRLGGLGLFYFAGHGVQVEGENYLIPLGARLTREQDARYSAVALGRILVAMEDADNGLNLVILDACRNNPFTRSWRSSQRGLAVVAAAEGMMIAYATAPGKIAADGSGRNGTYTQHLLQHLATPGLPVELMLKQVRAGVASETQRAQIPWSASSLIGDVYLAVASQESQPQIVSKESSPVSVPPSTALPLHSPDKETPDLKSIVFKLYQEKIMLSGGFTYNVSKKEDFKFQFTSFDFKNGEFSSNFNIMSEYGNRIIKGKVIGDKLEMISLKTRNTLHLNLQYQNRILKGVGFGARIVYRDLIPIDSTGMF